MSDVDREAQPAEMLPPLPGPIDLPAPPNWPPPPTPPVSGPSRPSTGDSNAPPPATWRPIEVIPVFLLAAVAALVASVPLAFLSSRGVVFVAAELIGEIAFGVAVLFWVRVVNHGPLAALGAPRRPFGDIGAGIVTGGVLTVVAIMAGYIVQVIATAILGHAPAQPDQIPGYVSGPALAIAGVVVVLAAPFGEELLFRGFLYKALRRRWSVWPAMLLSAAAFAALHVQAILVFAIFPVGIGLAVVYEWRQSILASMAAHATFNLVGFITIVLSRR